MVDSASLVELNAGRDQHVDQLSTAPDEAGLMVDEFPGLPQPRDGGKHSGARLLGDKLGDETAKHLAAFVAHDPEPMIVDRHEPPVCTDRVQHHGRVVVQRPVALLVLLRSPLGSHALELFLLQRRAPIFRSDERANDTGPNATGLEESRAHRAIPMGSRTLAGYNYRLGEAVGLFAV